MSKFFKNFFKFFTILFGILFLAFLIALFAFIFVAKDHPSTYFGITFGDEVIKTLADLGITSTSSFPSVVFAIIVKATGGGIDVMHKIESILNTVCISVMAAGSTILGGWLLFAFFYSIKTKKIAGIYFSSNKTKQLIQIEEITKKLQKRAKRIRNN